MGHEEPRPRAACLAAQRFAAGMDIPVAAPQTPAPMASQAYGDRPAGLAAISSSPAASVLKPAIIGHRYPVRRSRNTASPAMTIMPTNSVSVLKVCPP